MGSKLDQLHAKLRQTMSNSPPRKRRKPLKQTTILEAFRRQHSHITGKSDDNTDSDRLDTEGTVTLIFETSERLSILYITLEHVDCGANSPRSSDPQSGLCPLLFELCYFSIIVK